MPENLAATLPFLLRPVAGPLAPLDLLILAAAVGVLFLITFLVGRKTADTGDYFLGKAQVPSIIACLSFVATEVSAVSLLGVPATGFSENWNYLQFFAGSAAARIFVAFLFLPVFYKHDCTSIYEFLRDRFGPQTQYTGSIFFFFTRLIGAGVRLYAACMGIAGIMGWPLGPTTLLFVCISIAFIGIGGIKAVVWNGAYLALMYYGVGIMMAVYLLSQIPGPWSQAWDLAQHAGRLSLFKFSGNVNGSTSFWADPTTFWAGTANAFFLGLAVFGTDQELVQKLLTVKTRRSSQKTIIGTVAAALPFAAIYLSVGTLLFVFYAQHPGVAGPAEPKLVLSHFVVHTLPAGMKALVLAIIVLASVDLPLNSLTSSFMTDIYRPLIRKGASEKHYLWISRVGVAGFGAILAVIAISCSSVTNVLWFAFKVVSVTGGSMFGIFLLGMLTKRKGGWGNVVAMTVSTAAMATLLILSNYGIIPLAWTWLIVIGTFTTFGLGYVLGWNAKFSPLK